jgi:hypothetical protein
LILKDFDLLKLILNISFVQILEPPDELMKVQRNPDRGISLYKLRSAGIDRIEWNQGDRISAPSN